MNQVKKMKPNAPQRTMKGSLVFMPTQTLPSKNCWAPAKSGINAIGRYRVLMFQALQLAKAPPLTRKPLAAKLTGAERHMDPLILEIGDANDAVIMMA